MQHQQVEMVPSGDARAGEALYRTLFEAASDCILVLDRDGRLLDLNHQVCRILGCSREELLGDAFTRMLSPEALGRIYPRPAHIGVERRNVRGEQELRGRDGVVHHVEFVASPLPDGNVMVIVRDVSDRKRLELERIAHNRILEERVAERTADLRALNRELETFSYSVSHDLRAPVRNVRGMTSILFSDFGARLAGEPLQCVERIECNARRMEDLIDDLLIFSRARGSALNGVPVEMRPLVDAAVADHLAAWGGRARVRIGGLPECTGDPGLLRQVWDNLIGNALKYSSKVEAPIIEIGGVHRGAMLEYWVSDNGAGFDMGKAGRLFDAFQRLHSDDDFAGTGIGLATVRRIVERHGGCVSAQGGIGTGATFRFTLPNAESAPEPSHRLRNHGRMLHGA